MKKPYKNLILQGLIFLMSSYDYSSAESERFELSEQLPAH